MNKNDLITSVADIAGITKADASRAADAVIDAITSALKTGDEVRLVGFGTFSVSKRAATEGRNPRTGEKIKIPESRQPKFKAGKVTVMVKLQNPIGEKEVDINVTDAATGKAVETFPFTVQPSWDYIHFDDVEFGEKGKYKVSCIKKNGDVIATGEVEII